MDLFWASQHLLWALFLLSQWHKALSRGPWFSNYMGAMGALNTCLSPSALGQSADVPMISAQLLNELDIGLPCLFQHFRKVFRGPAVMRNPQWLCFVPCTCGFSPYLEPRWFSTKLRRLIPNRHMGLLPVLRKELLREAVTGDRGIFANLCDFSVFSA